MARAEPVVPGTSVLAGPPGALATDVARTRFSSAPVIVIADAGRAAAVSAAAAQAAQPADGPDKAAPTCTLDEFGTTSQSEL